MKFILIGGLIGQDIRMVVAHNTDYGQVALLATLLLSFVGIGLWEHFE